MRPSIIQITIGLRLCPCLDFLKGISLAVVRVTVTLVTDVEDITDPTTRTSCEEVEPEDPLLVTEVTTAQQIFDKH